jgi:hypothetical protein
MEREINQFGQKSTYIENAENVYLNVIESNLTQEQIIERFNLASVDLESYNNLFGGTYHIDRSETDQLYNWILNDLQANETPIAILAGDAGSGKSVIFKDLFNKLVSNNIPVLGIKADRLVVRNIQELNEELELGDTIESIFISLSKLNQKFVLLVDQIDALSQSLSSDRKPLNTYHRMIQRLSHLQNIRIVISCRIYDLDYDPLLKDYKSKKKILTSLLSIEDVEKVMRELNILLPQHSEKIKNFLRIPLHLQLFTKLSNPEKMGETITLQSLYDEIWTEFILTKPCVYLTSSQNLILAIKEFADGMYNSQQLYLNGKTFESRFINEIKYLSTEGIISYSADRKIQFIHQSFFDYAYARTFIENGKKITESLYTQHQGLFVRSRTKQVLTYLRELNTEEYIEELDKIIFGDYRFHLKLMILNNLGFYPDPKKQEQEWVQNHLIKDDFLFKLFIESIYTIEWFRFLLEKIGTLQYFEKNDQEIISKINIICWRLVGSSTQQIISFLNTIKNIQFENSQNFISGILRNVPVDKIGLAIQLFEETYYKWDKYNLYHFLDNALLYNPVFVKDQLLYIFEENLKTLKGHSSDYIPGDHDGMHVFKELHKKHQNVAIPFFIEITKQICEYSKMTYLDESKNDDRIFDSMGYYLYSPHAGHHYYHQELYNFLLDYFDSHHNTDFDIKVGFAIPLLQSDLAMIVNLGVICVLKNLDKLKSIAFDILTTKRYYNTSSENLKYNINRLLNEAYGMYDQYDQIKINKVILNIKPEWEKQPLGPKKGVSKYGYTRIGYTAYGYVSMIPELERNKHSEITKFYKECNRKWDVIENKKPQGIEIRAGDTTLSKSAYDNMTNEQWKSSFREIVSDSHIDWNKPTRTGHCRSFQEYVKQSPAKYIKLISEIATDQSILPIYTVYGLQGLKEFGYDPEVTKSLFIQFLNNRFYNYDFLDKSNREWLQYSVWLVGHFIDNNVVDRDIIEFLKKLINEYPDEEMLNDDPVNDGINRVRGAAASNLVDCYEFMEFEEDIFSTLESMAQNSAVHTRAAALYKLAYLNNLNKERNLKLYLDLVSDYNPLLLKIPLHSLHPLVYLVHVDFKELIPFFEKAITVHEARKPISHVLFIAWANGYEQSEGLLNKVLCDKIAIKTVVEAAFELTENEKYKEQAMSIIIRFLNEDDEDLGKTYEFGLHKIGRQINDELISFIDQYTYSSIGKYRSHYYYEILLSLAKDIPHKVIEWALAFKNHLKPDIQMRYLQNEPIQVILLAYNAVREYNKKDLLLEKALDAFDMLLMVPEYRNSASVMLTQIDA